MRNRKYIAWHDFNVLFYYSMWNSASFHVYKSCEFFSSCELGFTFLCVCVAHLKNYHFLVIVGHFSISTNSLGRLTLCCNIHYECFSQFITFFLVFVCLLFLIRFLKIILFIFGCAGSSLLHRLFSSCSCGSYSVVAAQ